MSLATAACASTVSRPAFAGTARSTGTSTNGPRASSSREAACLCSGRVDLARQRRAPRHRRGDVQTYASVSVGDAQWYVNQGLAAAVILGGFVATGGLEELGLGGEEEKDFREDPSEPCSMCEGTGRTECACMRWSEDGEGCESCGYSGVTFCPACRGGGRAVRVTLEIPVEQDELADMARENVRFESTSPFLAAIATPRLPDSPSGQFGSAALDEPIPHAVVAEPRSNSSSEGGPGGENDGNPSSSKDDDFYAQSGEAIRTLREDYPDLLQKQMSWGIYREDIGLVDETESFGHARGHVVASGIKEYKRCHKWLRTAAAVLFSHSEVQVSRIWSPLGMSGDRSIKVRWCIKARLRIVGGLTEEAHFDGISEYKLDKRGFIYQHTITDLDWDVAQMRDRIAELSHVLGQRAREPQLGSGQWFKDLVPAWLTNTSGGK